MSSDQTGTQERHLPPGDLGPEPLTRSPHSRTTRRQFLRTAAGAAGAVALGAVRATPQETAEPLKGLPTRVLGRTGLEVAILSLGLGASGDGKLDPAAIRENANLAIDLGVNYLDAAPNYGVAQAAVGPLLAERHDEVFVASKVEAQTREGALAQIERTRRDMQVDTLDVLLIHNVGDFGFAHMMGPDGAFTALRQARDAGHARFLGVSGHNRPGVFPRVIETGEIDVVMLPMNFVDRRLYGFEEKVLPVAREHDCGVIGMKVLGGVPHWDYTNLGHARLAAPEHYANAVRYALSLDGMATACMGLCSMGEVRTAVAAVQSFEPLTDEELAALLAEGERLAPHWGFHYGPPT
jgi:predicted aldo/keto reductase-like oxidoreductase